MTADKLKEIFKEYYSIASEIKYDLCKNNITLHQTIDEMDIVKCLLKIKKMESTEEKEVKETKTATAKTEKK